MKKEDYIDIINKLKLTYPDAKCSLDFEEPYQLVIAVMLSAQCTDERVNKTTPFLFKKYSTVYALAEADLSEVEEIIHPCGFYKNKAKNAISCAQKLVSDYNGIVPCDMDKLLTLPGIGRKSANVILLEVFGIANGIAVDTHCKRIANRIGLSYEQEPSKIEDDLVRKFPHEYLKDVNHLFIYFGRDICNARNAKCDICPICEYCKTFIDKKPI